MIKRLTTIALAALLIGMLSSCLLDPKPKEKVDDPPGVQHYLDLTEPWHVLNNLEWAYKEKNIVEYQKIFDPVNFTFFFYSGDVGGDVPVSWGYTDEISSATNMFTQQPDKDGLHPILTIDLQLYDKEVTTSWVDVDPPPEFAGETWKRATINYNFSIVTDGDLTYIPKGAPQAVFTVHQVDGLWKLVVWQDLANG